MTPTTDDAHDAALDRPSAGPTGAADLFTKSDLQKLLTAPRPPCVSVFAPTHRGGAEKDPGLWKNLLGEAQERLIARGMGRQAAHRLLEPARELLRDHAFWGQVSDGVAFFLAEGFSASFRLPLAFRPLAVVAERAHVVPLLPLLTGDGRFYVLALSQNRIAVLQGTHFSVHEIDVKGLPHNLEEALRFHDTDEPLVFHTHPALGLGRWGAIFHGHGVGIDDFKDDLVQYFRQIDRGLHELLRDEHAPLVLASVEHLWPLYRQANTYPHLLERGAAGNPDRLGSRELHRRAWPLVEPIFQEARRKAAALYEQAAGTGRTTDRLNEVVSAAGQGRVEILFAPRDVERWGALDAAGAVDAEHEAPLPGDEDLVNLAAVHTLRHGGSVYMVEPEGAPTGARLPAALLRRG